MYRLFELCYFYSRFEFAPGYARPFRTASFFVSSNDDLCSPRIALLLPFLHTTYAPRFLIPIFGLHIYALRFVHRSTLFPFIVHLTKFTPFIFISCTCLFYRLMALFSNQDGLPKTWSKSVSPDASARPKQPHFCTCGTLRMGHRLPRIISQGGCDHSFRWTEYAHSYLARPEERESAEQIEGCGRTILDDPSSTAGTGAYQVVEDSGIQETMLDGVSSTPARSPTPLRPQTPPSPVSKPISWTQVVTEPESDPELDFGARVLFTLRARQIDIILHR
jgi:hypothetical protein